MAKVNEKKEIVPELVSCETCKCLGENIKGHTFCPITKMLTIVREKKVCVYYVQN